MKPPCCHLCHKVFGAEYFHTRGGGGLVQFRDYKPLPRLYVGHPFGLEWFCNAHLEAAENLANLDVAEAMVALEEQFGKFEHSIEDHLDGGPFLLVTDVGPNRAKVFSLIRQSLGISPAQAKALMEVVPFPIAEGWPLSFRWLEIALKDVGATTTIKYD